MSAAAISRGSASSVLAALEPQPADALLALIGLHRADPREDKIDVGVGVYRDADGRTPVFGSVKVAERHLLEQQASKAYLGPEGDERYTELLAPIAFGKTLAESSRIVGFQTPGGTGALRLGAELLARAAPGRRIWLGAPTWPNHVPILTQAGLRPQLHRYFDVGRSRLDFAGMIASLATAAWGDIVLLHGCCHNPTGADLSVAEWRDIADLLVTRGIVPFVDLAYQGLGQGLDQDAAGLRLVLESVEEALVAYSCDKNFGLYRERVGALWVMAGSSAAVAPVRDNIHALARALWSMPPDHGAAIVRIILDDPGLANDWHDELGSMRHRIRTLRSMLAAADPRLAPIGRQHGIFATLPIDAAAVAALRERDGIYMAGTGRINIAGLQERTIPAFVAALAPFLPS